MLNFWGPLDTKVTVAPLGFVIQKKPSVNHFQCPNDNERLEPNQYNRALPFIEAKETNNVTWANVAKGGRLPVHDKVRLPRGAPAVRHEGERQLQRRHRFVNFTMVLQRAFSQCAIVPLHAGCRAPAPPRHPGSAFFVDAFVPALLIATSSTSLPHTPSPTQARLIRNRSASLHPFTPLQSLPVVSRRKGLRPDSFPCTCMAIYEIQRTHSSCYAYLLKQTALGKTRTVTHLSLIHI